MKGFENWSHFSKFLAFIYVYLFIRFRLGSNAEYPKASRSSTGIWRHGRRQVTANWSKTITSCKWFDIFHVTSSDMKRRFKKWSHFLSNYFLSLLFFSLPLGSNATCIPSTCNCWIQHPTCVIYRQRSSSTSTSRTSNESMRFR